MNTEILALATLVVIVVFLLGMSFSYIVRDIRSKISPLKTLKEEPVELEELSELKEPEKKGWLNELDYENGFISAKEISDKIESSKTFNKTPLASSYVEHQILIAADKLKGSCEINIPEEYFMPTSMIKLLEKQGFRVEKLDIYNYFIKWI